MLPSQAQLTDQIVRLIDIRLLDPLEILLDGDESIDALRTVIRVRAESWARRIVDSADGDSDPVGVIMRLVSTLYTGDGLFEPPLDWWQTPLGQALIWRVGHPTAHSVPYPVAGAMLGITRQGVHDLVTRGKLARHPDGGVDPASVRRRVRQLAGQVDHA